MTSSGETTPLFRAGSAASAFGIDIGATGRPSGISPLEVAASVAMLNVRRLRRRTTLFGKNKVVHKAMGAWGSFLFLSNLITGPGMLGLPAAFLSGGYVVAGGSTCLFAAMSALCCAFIAHSCRVYRAERLRATVSPGAFEHDLKHHPHLEFETLVRALAHPALWLAFQVVFFFSMCLMAISCIVVTASSLDTLSLLLFDNAYGLQLSPRFGWVASCNARDAGAPGGCAARPVFADTAAAGGHILSVGYMLCLAVTVPFALVEISEAFQATAYFVSLICLLQLITKFAAIAYFPSLAGGGADAVAGSAVLPPPPLLRPVGWDLGLVAEVSFWSWCISFAVPMWLDEKAETLPISRPLWLAFTHRALLDLLLGWTGAAAFPRMGPQRLNVLDAVAVHPACGVLTKGCGVVFVISSLAPNIVDYSMVAARNLECHVGTQLANAMGIGLPFALAWMFYFGHSFSSLVNLASPFLNGMVQFVGPALLFAAYERMDTSGGASGASGGSAASMASGGGGGGLAPERTVRVLGLSMPIERWRAVAVGLASFVAVLICATYALNAAVGAGVIRAGSGGAGVSGGDYVS